MSSPYLFATTLRTQNTAAEEQATNIVVTNPSYSTAKLPDIPKNFDGRKAWKLYLSRIRDQADCGGCYAYAMVGMLADRYAIQSANHVHPDLSALSCIICMLDVEGINGKEFKEIRENENELVTAEENHLAIACAGNTLYNVGRFLYRAGVPEVNCANAQYIKDYRKRYGKYPLCIDILGPNYEHCMNANGTPNDRAARHWNIHAYYRVGQVPLPVNGLTEQNYRDDERAIMYELMKFGPIAAGINVYNDLLTTYANETKNGARSVSYPHNIYAPKIAEGEKPVGGHAIRVVGWGTTDGVDYWIIANSWGTSWGEDGYFKMKRRDPHLQLEMNTLAVWPELPEELFTRGIGFVPTMQNVNPDDEAMRAYNAFDPEIKYSALTIDAIRDGKLKGKLQPLFTTADIPNNLTYWAYRAPDNKPNLIGFLPANTALGVTGGKRQNTGSIVLVGVIVFVIVCFVGLLSYVCYKYYL